MSSLIKHKKEKVAAVFEALGPDRNEEAFSRRFRELYPEDWERIICRWQEEVLNTTVGKGHMMPHPQVYIHEMYRNHVKTFVQKHSDAEC